MSTTVSIADLQSMNAREAAIENAKAIQLMMANITAEKIRLAMRKDSDEQLSALETQLQGLTKQLEEAIGKLEELWA